MCRRTSYRVEAERKQPATHKSKNRLSPVLSQHIDFDCGRFGVGTRRLPKQSQTSCKNSTLTPVFYYRVLDYAYSSSPGARNEAPVTIYGGSYRWDSIIHTHPERHSFYQLSGSGAYGKGGKYYYVGLTHDSDVAQAFNRNTNMYVVPPSGPITFFRLRDWKNAVDSNSKSDEVIYAGTYEKSL